VHKKEEKAREFLCAGRCEPPEIDLEKGRLNGWLAPKNGTPGLNRIQTMGFCK